MAVKEAVKPEKSEIVITQNKTNAIKEKKRDVTADLIRVIACFMVIGAHLCLQVLNRCYNRIDWSRLLEKSYFADGVPIFLMLTGFFLVNRT